MMTLKNLFARNNVVAANEVVVETVEVKEETTMTMKERFAAARKNGYKMGVEAANKTGYGLGYATETVRAEVSGVARKVADAINSNDFVVAGKDGFYDGKNDAYMAYADRCVKREEKARAKADNKAAKAAAELSAEVMPNIMA